MAIPPRKKPKADIALLLGEPEEKPGDLELDEEPDDDLDDLELDEDMPEEDPLDPLADPLAEESSIPPEQADLAVTLGFTEPDQQQALIDLIKLVTAAPTDMGMESEPPPLPESPY